VVNFHGNGKKINVRWTTVQVQRPSLENSNSFPRFLKFLPRRTLHSCSFTIDSCGDYVFAITIGIYHTSEWRIPLPLYTFHIFIYHWFLWGLPFCHFRGDLPRIKWGPLILLRQLTTISVFMTRTLNKLLNLLWLDHGWFIYRPSNIQFSPNQR